jgi:hypothetical protein
MSNGTASALNSEQDLASIPMAQGGLSRLAIARLKSAGVPVAPLLKRVGVTPELIAEPEERLFVRSQIALSRIRLHLGFASVLRFCTIAARWNSSRAPERPLSRMRLWRRS